MKLRGALQDVFPAVTLERYRPAQEECQQSTSAGVSLNMSNWIKIWAIHVLLGPVDIGCAEKDTFEDILQRVSSPFAESRNALLPATLREEIMWLTVDGAESYLDGDMTVGEYDVR